MNIKNFFKSHKEISIVLLLDILLFLITLVFLFQKNFGPSFACPPGVFCVAVDYTTAIFQNMRCISYVLHCSILIFLFLSVYKKWRKFCLKLSLYLFLNLLIFIGIDIAGEIAIHHQEPVDFYEEIYNDEGVN